MHEMKNQDKLLLDCTLDSTHLFSKEMENSKVNRQRWADGHVHKSNQSISYDDPLIKRVSENKLHESKDHLSNHNFMMYNTKNSFPVKLHWILSNPDFESIISWLPNGRSWRVLQPKLFTEKVIPLYFRHTRFPSFMRQVNGWGFSRVSKGSGDHSYFHELFRKDSPLLCLRMRRANMLGRSKEQNQIVDGEKTPRSPQQEKSRDSSSPMIPSTISSGVDPHPCLPVQPIRHMDGETALAAFNRAGVSYRAQSIPSLLIPNVRVNTRFPQQRNVAYGLQNSSTKTQLQALQCQEQYLQQRIQNRLNTYFKGQNAMQSQFNHPLLGLNFQRIRHP